MQKSLSIKTHVVAVGALHQALDLTNHRKQLRRFAAVRLSGSAIRS